MPVSLSNLTALSAIAGFDLATLFNNGTLNIPDSQFSTSVMTPGDVIAKAIISAGVDPVQNGIPLFEALAGVQYDNLSAQSLIQLLVVYARQAGTGTAVPQDVGAAIANLVSGGSLTASEAVSYVVQAALAVSGDFSLFGVTSTVNANTTGQILGAVLGPLQGVLGSDPIAAGVQDLVGLVAVGTSQLNLLAGLGAAHAASVAVGFEGLLGSAAQSLTNGDLTLASTSAGTDIANAVYTAYGTNTTGSSVGIGLIQALALENNVDPIPALVAFTYQLSSQTGGSAASVAGTALSQFISSALVTSPTAASDITNTAIAIAAAATTNPQAVLVGEVFAALLNKTGSSALATAVNSASSPQPPVIAAINGTTLTYAQGLAFLVGVSIGANGTLGESTTWSEIAHEISTLVTNTAVTQVTQTQVVNLLASFDAAGLSSPYMTASGLTYAQIGSDLLTAVLNAQVTATQALSFLQSIAVFYGQSTALTNAGTTLAVSLVNDHQITQIAALNSGVGTSLGILAGTSGTIAAAIATYQYLLDNNFIENTLPFLEEGSDARTTIAAALSDGTLSPVYNSALAPGIAAASGVTSTDAPSGSTLTFASLPSGVSPGFLVVDQTNSGAIAQGTTVASVSGNTVTLSTNVMADVASGDTIAFYNQGVALAIEMLSVTPTDVGDSTPDNQIFTYINQGNIGIQEAIDVIVNAVAATGGSLAQQIAELVLVASNFTSSVGFGTINNNPNTALMTAVGQEILTLYDAATPSFTAANLASAFAMAYATAGVTGNQVQESFIINILTDMGSLTHQGGQSALPLANAVFGDLIATSGTATASQPLTPVVAASDIAGGAIVTSNTGLITLITVAGTAQNGGFDFTAGQYIAEGIDHHGGTLEVFSPTLDGYVQDGTIDRVDAALLLGSVAASTFLGTQSVSQTSDFLTLLGEYATADSSVLPAFGTAITSGYDVYTAIQALALIGGAAPSLQTQVQNEIVSILQSGVNGVTGDIAIGNLLQMSQLVASSVSGSDVSTTLNASVQNGIAGDIAAMIQGGFATVTSAVTDIGDFVGGELGSDPNVAANMIDLLEYLATYDANHSGPIANLEALADNAAAGTLSVQAEIALIIGAREIGLGTANNTLVALDQTVASGSPLDEVISAEIGLIGSTGAALLLSAAQGNPSAQVLQAEALKISQRGDNLVVSSATNAAASTGTTLSFASLPSGAAAGLVVVDLTSPGAIVPGTTVASTSGSTVTLSAGVTSVGSGDDIVFYRAPVDSATTNAATSTGTTINFGSLPLDVVQGLTVLDLSNPAAFAAGTYVASINGNAVTLSAGVAGPVGSGDTIAFLQPGIADVLDALIGNIGGSVTAANAISLLLDLAAIGAANTANPALADATVALVTLVTSNISGADAGTIVSFNITPRLTSGTLTSTAGLSILEALAKANATAEGFVQSAYAEGLDVGYFTIAQIDAAVTAGAIAPIDAIAALSQAAGNLTTTQNPAVTVANIATELVKLLQANPGLDAQALALMTAAAPTPSFVTLFLDGPSQSAIASAYAAVNTIVTAIPTLGQGFFASILNVATEFSTDSDLGPPAIAELFGAGGLVATGAISADDAITAILTFPQSQQLSPLVQLAGVSSAQSAVIDQLNQIVDNPGNTNSFITVDTVIGAFAFTYGGNSAFTEFYQELLTQLGQNSTGATGFIDALEDAGVPTNNQLAVLVSVVSAYQPSALEGITQIQGIVNTLVARIDTLISSGSPTAIATSLAGLLNSGVFTGTQVIQTVAGFYGVSAPQEFIAVVDALPGAGISAATVTGGIVSAVAAGVVSTQLGVDLLLVVGTQTTPGLQTAAAVALGSALASSAPIAANASTSIGAAISANVVTAGQVVTFMTQVLLTTPSTLSFVTSEIGSMVTTYGLSGLQVITAMAQALAPNALVASGATNAATASGNTLDFASVPAGVSQALTAIDLNNPGAIPFGDEVTGITGTTVTLSLGVTSAIQSGDTIAFYNNLTEDDTIEGQIAVLGAAISALTASYNFTALQEANAILAAVGYNTADLNPDYGITLLAAFAGQSTNAANMEAIGEAVAGLVTAGTVTPFVAAADLYNAHTVLSLLSPGQLVNIAVGLLSGGSAATAAQLLQNLLDQNVGSISTIVAAFDAAIGTPTNAVTALGIVDVATLVLADGGSVANAAALISPLIANNTLTGASVVAEMANFVGASPGVTADNFMSLLAAVAATTGSSAAEQISMGVGLATALGANRLSFSTVATDLGLAINGVFAGNTEISPPVITLDQGVAILIGAAAGGSAFAAGEAMGALVAGNAGETQTAIGDIETALSGGSLTNAEALSLLTGVFAAGAQTAAGAAVVALFQAGQISQIDLDTLTGSAIAGNASQTAAAYFVASAYPFAPTALIAQDLINSLTNLITLGNFPLQFNGEIVAGQGEIQGIGPDGVTLAQLGDPVSGPGVPSGATIGTILNGGAFILADGVTGTQTNFSGTFTITENAAAVEAQIVAALLPATELTNLIQVLVGLGTAASPASLGQTLFSIIESGAASAGDVVAAIQATGATSGPTFTTTPLFALGSLAQIAAIQPAGSYAVDPATIQTDVYNAIIAMFPPSDSGPTESAAQFVAQYYGGLIAQSEFFKSIFLPVLVQLAVRDPSDYLTGSGSELNTLLGNGTISVTDLSAALMASGVTGGAALVVLAGAIDIGVLTGAIQINQNAAVENELLLAYRLVTGSVVSPTNLQSYATALQTAAGLPVKNAVGGLALLFAAVTATDGGGVSLAAFVDTSDTTGKIVPASIASLVSSGQITEADAYTIIGQTYQATGFTAAALPSLMGLVGYALGDTATTFVSAVAAGSYGGQDATIDILLRLTGITGQDTGGIPDPAADASNNGALVFPNIGLAVGVELIGLVVAHGFSLSQVLADIAAIPFNTGNISASGADPGVSDNNKLLILLGMLNGAASSGLPGPGGIATGNAPMQIAIGASLGNLLNAGAQPDLTVVRGVITYDQWALLLAGVVTTANTATATGIAQLFGALNGPAINPPQEFPAANLPVPTGTLSASQLAGDLDTAVQEGALSAAGGLATLEVFAAGVPAAIGTLGTEVLALIGENQVTASAAIAALLARAGSGTLDMQVVAGGFIGAIENHGLASDSAIQAAIDAAITGNSLTAAQAVVVDGAAGTAGSGALAATLGADIGAMIANNEIALADAVSAIASGASTYAFNFTALGINTDLTNEVAMLVGVATTDTVAGAQLAIGEAIGGLVNQNDVRTAAEAVAAIGGATGSAAGDLTPAQAIQVLIGVAVTAGAAGSVGGPLTEAAVAGEFDGLIGAGTLAASDVITGLGQAIQAGTLSTAIGMSVFVQMAAQNGSLTSAVTGGIASLINGGVVTPDQALAALFAAAGTGVYNFALPLPAVPATIAVIVTALESQASITPVEAGQELATAATGGSIGPDEAVAILLALSADATSGAASQAALDTLAGLLSNDIGGSALSGAITQQLFAGTITAGTAITTLIGIAMSSAASFPAVDITVGATLGTITEGFLPPFLTAPQQLVGALQAAVTGGSLTTGVGAALLVQTAVNLEFTVNGLASDGAFAAALVQLAEAGTPAATHIFTDIEALAAAQGGNYDTASGTMEGFGVLIAELAIGANAALQAAVAAEFNSLVTRNLITSTQAASYIGAALGGGLSTDTATLLYATGVPSQLIAGQGIAALVNAGSITVAQALSDIAAAVPGTLSLDGEIQVIAGMAAGLTVEGSRNALSSALIQLIESQTATAAQVFSDLAAVAQLNGSYSAGLGILLVGMGATSDTALQLAVSNEIGTLINSAALTPAGITGDIAAATAAGQLTPAQANALMLPLLANAGPALQAAIGAAAGPLQAAAFIAAQGAGTITATELVGALTGMATASQDAFVSGLAVANGPGFVSATAGLLNYLLTAFPYASGTSPSSGATTLLNDFVSLNNSEGSTNPSAAVGRLWDDAALLTDNLLPLNGTVPIWISLLGFDLVSDFGAFGSNSAQVQFETAIVNQGLSASDALTILNEFSASAPLAPSNAIASLVTNGALTVSAAMAAIEAAAAGSDPTHLLYFLADLSASPALRAAAAQEIASLVQNGTLTGSAAAAGIAAIINSTASTNGVLGTISTPAGVALMLAVYGDSQDATLRAGVLQQLIGFFANPPSDINQSAIVAAIGNAVTNGQMSAATALQTLIQMDGAGGPGATGTVNAAIEGLVAGYVGSNYAAFTSQLLTDAANVTSSAGLTSLGWLLGAVTVPVSGFTTAISDIAGAEQAGTITGAQEASMLLGLFPDLLTIYNLQTASFPENIPLATTETSRLALINQWIADATSVNSAAFAILTDLSNLVTSGAITPQALIADVSAAGTAGINLSGALTPAQQLQVLVGSGVYDSNPALVVTALVGATNTFDTRGYVEVVHDVIEMSGGNMTFDQAIVDVEGYAYTHNADVDAAITELVTLTQQVTPGSFDFPATVPYLTTGNAGTTIIQTNINTAGHVNISDAFDAIDGRADDGAFAGDLAVEVVEGVAGLLPGAPSLTQAANELSGFQQAAFYNDVVSAAYFVRLSSAQSGPTHDALTDLINSVPAQPNGSSTSSSNLFWTVNSGGKDVSVSSATTLTTGFFQDEAWAAEIHALSALSGSAATQNTGLTVDDLETDLTDGYAETSIINMLASGQFNGGQADQNAISALNDLLAPVMGSETAQAAQWTQAVSYAWLALKSVEYIEGNYQITTNSSGQQTIVIPSSPVPALYGDLIDEYVGNSLNPNQQFVLTGLGALAALQGYGVLTQSDTNMVARLTQTIFNNDAVIAGGTDLASDVNAGLNSLQGPLTSYMQGFALVGNPQSGASGSSTSYGGIMNGLIDNKGKDAQAYFDFGSRIAAQGVPGLGLLNFLMNLAENEDIPNPFPSLQDLLLKGALGDAGGAISTGLGIVGGIGAVGSLIFSFNAVDNALGISDQQKDALEGSFGILNETGNLIGNILTGELASVASAGIAAATDFGDAFADMAANNPSGVLENAEQVATFMYEMANFGFNPADLGADAEAFGATMVDLFSGNTGNLAADGAALGAALLHTLTNNLFVASAMATVEQAIANINADWNEFLIGIGAASPPPPPPPPPPPTITLPDGTTVQLINDNLGDGGQAYKDPSSTSNWGSFYHGTVTDGYIANANVFVDPTGTGVFQTGDYTTTTDAAGNYSLPAGITGTVVITGGTDIATGLPFTGTFTAPTGSSSVTALTTLINAIAASNGGDIAAATQQVDAALGLPSTVDPTQTNPIIATQTGTANAAQLLGATVQVQNTLSLLTAAGGSGAATALANAITALSGGSTLDLTNPTTVTNIATSAGIDPTTAAATGMLASTSNSAVQQQVANATSAQDLLTTVTAVSIVTQGSTAQQLAQSIGNANALSNTVSNNTGSNFTSQVTNSTSLVGNLSPVSLNPANGTLGLGAKVQVTLNLADRVSVNTTGGTPTLALNVNENATFDPSASTATALVFDYTVQAGDNTPELETAAAGISLNGGTITDLVTNGPANLSGAQSAVPAGLLTIDTVPPPAPSAPVLAAASAFGSPGDDIANTSDPTFTGTAEAGTTVTLYAGAVSVGSAVAGANGYSVTLTYPLAQGSYAFTATATNAVGTVSAASPATTVVLPGIPAITGTASDQPTILDAPIAPFANVTITDPAAGATETLTITLGGGGGTLAGSGLTGSDGSYTLSGSDAAVTSELDALIFTPTPAGSETAATTIFELSDQSSSLPVPVLGMASVTDYGVGTIVSVAPSTATGTLRVGTSLTITLAMSSPVAVSGAPTLSLNDSGTATYDAAASTSSALVFDYTVGEGEQAETALAVTDVNLPGGATIVDGLGNNANLALPPSATFGGLRVDTNPAGALTGNGLSDLVMLNGNTGALILDEVGAGPAMTYTPLGGLGPEWQFEGDGSFLGGTDGFLLWDGSSANPSFGTLVVGEDAGGTAQYIPIGGVGPEWQFEGNGALLGQSADDVLLWNGSSASPDYGALAVGAVVNGALQYTAIGGVGPNWQFEGVGDYLGNGKAGFLMEDQNTGNLVVGEDIGGSAQYTLVGGIGPEWQFEGSGNLLGHGEDDFLIRDGSSASPSFGALVVGEVTGGTAQYTLIGGVGSEWQFLGVGNYDGASSAEFMMRNGNTGALVLGTVINGTATYTAVGGVGPEWNFHTTNPATLA